MHLLTKRIGDHSLPLPTEPTAGGPLVLLGATDVVCTVGIPTALHTGFSFTVPAGHELQARLHPELVRRGFLSPEGIAVAVEDEELVVRIMLATPQRSSLAPRPIMNVQIPGGKPIALARLVLVEPAVCVQLDRPIDG